VILYQTISIQLSSIKRLFVNKNLSLYKYHNEFLKCMYV
jgi:hypothetical protein